MLATGACHRVSGGGFNGKPVSRVDSVEACGSGAAPATVSEERAARQATGLRHEAWEGAARGPTCFRAGLALASPDTGLVCAM